MTKASVTRETRLKDHPADARMRKALGWAPIRRGAVYCSRGCGGGCLWAAYLRAVKLGETTVKLLGKGWRYRVWENLGWHVEALCGGLSVRPSRNEISETTTYWAMMGNPQHAGSGLMEWLDPEHKHHRTPLAACKTVLKIARAEQAKREKWLRQAEAGIHS